LPDQARLDVAAGARTRDAEKGEILFREGDPVREFGVLARGRVKLSRVAAGGSAAIVRLISPAEACDWPGMLTDELHSSTAVAAQRSRVLVWEQLRLIELFDRHPVLYRNALRILARRQRELSESYRELSALRVPQRLARAVLRLASPSGRWLEKGGLSEIPLSRKDLAQLAGTTLFTVSRLLSEWEGDGIIETRRECVRVEKPDALAVIGRFPGP
jgi:CRP-like cAMP-binding protein